MHEAHRLAPPTRLFFNQSNSTLKENGMRETMVSVVVLALMALAPVLAAAAEDQAPPKATQDQGAVAEGQSPPAKCLEAEVNPVTGHVLCVKPRGAPVDPPNLADEPCQKHADANGT
jgi:hypothetical protein